MDSRVRSDFARERSPDRANKSDERAASQIQAVRNRRQQFEPLRSIVQLYSRLNINGINRMQQVDASHHPQMCDVANGESRHVGILSLVESPSQDYSADNWFLILPAPAPRPSSLTVLQTTTHLDWSLECFPWLATSNRRKPPAAPVNVKIVASRPDERLDGTGPDGI